MRISLVPVAPAKPITIQVIPMSSANRKVIISCAITGATHTPSMSEYLPITPAEIERQSIEAAEAGAAVLHLHARDPVDGRPTPDPAVFSQFVPAISRATAAIIHLTNGGRREERAGREGGLGRG